MSVARRRYFCIKLKHAQIHFKSTYLKGTWGIALCRFLAFEVSDCSCHALVFTPERNSLKELRDRELLGVHLRDMGNLTGSVSF